MKYEAVIGLEVHAELSTKSKIYCSCSTGFGAPINTHTCPVCTGMPGALPVLNKQVVHYAAKMGKATGCTINQLCKADRKNYFYPDLPKAYQISQFDVPICENGEVFFYVDGVKHSCRLERIHFEEDAGKLLHDEIDGTIVDFNRCGVPLIEMVTRPDLHSSAEAKEFLEMIKTTLSYLDICDCKMEEGSIRCDVNVSIRPEGSTELGTRVEMKNINTFSGAVRAIDYEIARQIEVVENGGEIQQETRRWDDVIDYCKAHPGEVQMGGSSNASVWHIAGGYLMSATGIDIQMITYQEGAATAVQNAAGGFIQGVTVSLAEARSFIESGDLICLGVMDEERNPVFPDVPTCKEQGYDITYYTQRGMAAPLGVDDAIMTRLEEACAAAIEDPDFVTFMNNNGQAISYLDAQGYADYLKQAAVDVAAAMDAVGL